jgi:hypothetical protein
MLALRGWLRFYAYQIKQAVLAAALAGVAGRRRLFARLPLEPTVAILRIAPACAPRWLNCSAQQSLQTTLRFFFSIADGSAIVFKIPN